MMLKPCCWWWWQWLWWCCCWSQRWCSGSSKLGDKTGQQPNFTGGGRRASTSSSSFPRWKLWTWWFLLSNVKITNSIIFIFQGENDEFGHLYFPRQIWPIWWFFLSKVTMMILNVLRNQSTNFVNSFAKSKKVVTVKPGKLTVPKWVGKMLAFKKRESRLC